MCGVLLGHGLSQPRKNRVLQIAPESGRGRELEVKESDATNLRCDPVGNIPPQRFIKTYEAINIVKKGWFKLQNYALWLVREGTAYVTGLGKTPDEEVTLDSAFKTILNKEHYSQLPDYAVKKIKSGKLGVTIKFPSNPLTPKGTDGEDLPSISSDDLRRGDVDHFVSALASGVAKLSKTGAGDWPRIIFIMGTGIGIGIVLSLIFGWGAPTIING